MSVVVYPDASALARGTAARLLTELTDVLAVRGIAHVVLTGGRIGTAVLEAAGTSTMRDDIDWTSVHVWWADERFVAMGDPERNEGQAQRALLSRIPLPEDNIHRMGSASSFSSATDAAATYRRDLAAFGDPCPSFDVLLLGLGEDGHVASLFPGREDGGQGARGVQGQRETDPTVVAIEGAPKPPPTRISLTLRAINEARQVWLIAAGPEKARAVAGCLHGDETLPGSLVAGRDHTVWRIDAAAAVEV